MGIFFLTKPRQTHILYPSLVVGISGRVAAGGATIPPTTPVGRAGRWVAGRGGVGWAGRAGGPQGLGESLYPADLCPRHPDQCPVPRPHPPPEAAS